MTAPGAIFGVELLLLLSKEKCHVPYFRHADYRHEDYFFQRSQSRALSALEWEQSDKPLRSWSEFLYPTIAATGAVVAVVGMLV